MQTLTIRCSNLAPLRRTLRRIRQAMPVVRVEYQIKITVAEPQAMPRVAALLGTRVQLRKE